MWLKKAKNNYVRTYVSSKESLTTTTSIKWDTLILCVSYLSLYLASSRTGRIDIVDWPRCTGTISTVRYKHIQTCSPTKDGDWYTLIWYPVLLSHIYFVRFKNLAKWFIRHPAFLKYFLLNFFDEIAILRLGKVLYKYGFLELYWQYRQLWNISII